MMITEYDEPDDSAVDVGSNSNAKLFLFSTQGTLFQYETELGRSTSGVAQRLSVVAVNYVRLLRTISGKQEHGEKIVQTGGHVDHIWESANYYLYANMLWGHPHNGKGSTPIRTVDGGRRPSSIFNKNNIYFVITVCKSSMDFPLSYLYRLPYTMNI